MVLVFHEMDEIADDVWEFRFVPKSRVEYVPGQYARFTFPYVIPDPRGKQHRTFTLISHPCEQQIRFITRHDETLSNYKQHLFALQPGDIVHIDEPHGDAVLPRLGTTPLVFVAQGIAIASYISMLQECVLSDLGHSITLAWTRRSEDNTLEKLIPGEIRLLTRVDVAYPARLMATDILRYCQPNGLIYLSGSQTFVETLGAELEIRNIPRERLIYDYYEGYPVL